MPNTLPTSMFASLVQAFLSQSGNDPSAARDCLGFELDFHAGVVRVAPHPVRPTLGMVEIEMPDVDLEHAGTPAFLHRLNHAAILRHDWIVTIDDEDQAVLSNSFLIAETDATVLEALIGEGIERAEALSALLLSDFSAAAEPSFSAGILENFNPTDRA